MNKLITPIKIISFLFILSILFSVQVQAGTYTIDFETATSYNDTPGGEWINSGTFQFQDQNSNGAYGKIYVNANGHTGAYQQYITNQPNFYVDIFDGLISNSTNITRLDFIVDSISTSNYLLNYPQSDGSGTNQTIVSTVGTHTIYYNGSQILNWSKFRDATGSVDGVQGEFSFTVSTVGYALLNQIIIYDDLGEGGTDYDNTNTILFSNTTDYTKNITTHPINTLLYVTTFLNNSNWNFWTDAFANLRIFNSDGLQIEDLSIYQQNASQFSFTPVLDGVYIAEIYCGILCYPFTGETEYIFSSNTVTIEYPYNSPDDLLFSHTINYSTSITQHPLNESFYLNVWIEEGSSMRESDYFGHWRINVTSPDDIYLGTYYPVRSYYQGSYPIQISMDQFSGTGKFGNYTFKMFFALTPDDVNNGEVLIKESVIYLYNSSNYNDTGYYNNITEELGGVPDVDISNYTDVPELQFLNDSFSYDTFVWIATPIHSMHTGIDSINNYYSDTNNTQHITVLGSIVPILISELPEKIKLLFTYQIILTVILLIMGRD